MPQTVPSLYVDHPYYASDNNYFDNSVAMEHDTVAEFLEEWTDADVDMNLIYRFDVKKRDPVDSDDHDSRVTEHGEYYAEAFFIHQRKGIYRPVMINSYRAEDDEAMTALLTKHWETIKKMWAPISQPGVPPKED